MRQKRPTNEELLADVFPSPEAPATQALFAYCANRLATSLRFADFFAEHRGKIRKKVREAGEGERLRDLQLELETAYRLLADRRIEVSYEALAAQKGRSPDFTATYTIKYTFHVEVKRLRTSATAGSLGDAVSAKLGQLQPNAINVVVVGMSNVSGDPAQAMAALRERAERKDQEFFSRHGFRDAGHFFRQYRRLSALAVLARWDAEQGGETTLWRNPQAQHPLPPELRTLMAS